MDFFFITFVVLYFYKTTKLKETLQSGDFISL